MMMQAPFRLITILGLCGLMTWGVAATAQDNLFAPRVTVSGRVVTEYEVLQRAMFIKLLGGSGDPDAEAEKALVEEKLKLIEADRLKIKLTPEQITAGMTEFAGRANLSAEEFTAALAEGGVEPETFRDFVAAGILWREVVRATFAGKVTVSDIEVDRTLEGQTRTIGLRVLLSELVLPVSTEADRAAVTARANELRAQISGEGAFASAVGRYSAAPTAGRGGRLDWLTLANLPPALAKFVLALEPGQVSDPVQVQNAVVLFQLRDIAEDPTVAATPSETEYAQLLIPDDAGVVANIVANSDRCTDLYAFARGKDAAVLTVEKKLVADIPQDIAIELAKLDPGESSTVLTRGGSRMFLMLCSRAPLPAVPDAPKAVATADGAATPAPAPDPAAAREAVRNQLLNAKLNGLSEQLLEELRAAAVIKDTRAKAAGTP
ncbi:MAG: peptidylprolyl isomerase [Pseudomonadota bacterium]